MSSNLGDEGNSSGGGNTTNNNNANFRLWKYVTKSVRDGKAGGNTAFQCNYCQRTFKGSYSRVKTHLLKIEGYGIACCSKVTNALLREMERVVEEVELRIYIILIAVSAHTRILVFGDLPYWHTRTGMVPVQHSLRCFSASENRVHVCVFFFHLSCFLILRNW